MYKVTASLKGFKCLIDRHGLAMGDVCEHYVKVIRSPLISFAQWALFVQQSRVNKERALKGFWKGQPSWLLVVRSDWVTIMLSTVHTDSEMWLFDRSTDLYMPLL